MANPYFNATYYLTNNPDVFAAGINTVEGAWNHYVNYGAAESLAGAASRKPVSWFDAEYYLSNNPDLSTAGLTAGQLFDHFTTYGIDEGRAPSANAILTEANLLAYAKANEDLMQAFDIAEDAEELTPAQQQALARHFYAYGYNEDRPGAPFDPNGGGGGGGDVFTLTELPTQTKTVLEWNGVDADVALAFLQSISDLSLEDLGVEISGDKIVNVGGITITDNTGGFGGSTIVVTLLDGTSFEAFIDTPAALYAEIIDGLIQREEITQNGIVLTPKENNGGSFESGYPTGADDLIIAGRPELLHGAYIDGGGGYNTLEVDMKGFFAQPFQLLNIQEVHVQNLPSVYDVDQTISDLVDTHGFPLSNEDGGSNSILDLSRASSLERLVINEGGMFDSSGALAILGIKSNAVARLEGNFTQDVNLFYGRGLGNAVELEFANVTMSDGEVKLGHNAGTVNLLSEGRLNVIQEADFGSHLRELNITGTGELSIEEDLNFAFNEATIDASGNTGGLRISLSHQANGLTDVNIQGSQARDVIEVRGTAVGVVLDINTNSGRDTLIFNNVDAGAGSVIAGAELTIRISGPSTETRLDLVQLPDDASFQIDAGATLVVTQAQVDQLGIDAFGSAHRDGGTLKVLLQEDTDLSDTDLTDLVRELDLALELDDGVTLVTTREQLDDVASIGARVADNDSTVVVTDLPADSQTDLGSIFTGGVIPVENIVISIDGLVAEDSFAILGGGIGATLSVAGENDLTAGALWGIDEVEYAESGASLTLTEWQVRVIDEDEFGVAEGVTDVTLNVTELDGSEIDLAEIADAGINIGTLTVEDTGGTVALHADTTLGGADEVIVPKGTTLELTAEQFLQLNGGLISGEGTVNITGLTQADIDAGLDLSTITAVHGQITLADNDVTLDPATDLGEFGVHLVGNSVSGSPMDGQTIRFATAEQASRDITVSGDPDETNVVWLEDGDFAGQVVDTSGYSGGIGRLWISEALVESTPGHNVEALYTQLSGNIIVRIYTDDLLAVSNPINREVEVEAFAQIDDLSFVDADADAPFQHVQTLTITLGGATNIGDLMIDNIVAPDVVNDTPFTQLTINSYLADSDTHYLLPEDFDPDFNARPDQIADPNAQMNVIGDIGSGPNREELAYVVINTSGGPNSETGVALSIQTITFSETKAADATLELNGANNVTIKSLDTSDPEITGLTVTNSGVGTITVTGGSPAAAVSNTETLTITNNGGAVAFGTETDANDNPYAGVAGADLSLISVNGIGNVDLGVIAQVDSEDFTLEGNGTATTAAVLGEANVDDALVAPELSATGEWAIRDTALTFTEDVELNAGGQLTLGNVILTIEGDVDFTELVLVKEGGNNVVVPADATFTLTAEQADGLVISGPGEVIITELEATPGADLSGITAATTLVLTEDVVATGSMPDADVTIEGAFEVNVVGATLGADTTFEVPTGANLVLTESQADELTVTGDGAANVVMGAASVADLSGIAVETTITIGAHTSFSGTFNATLPVTVAGAFDFNITNADNVPASVVLDEANLVAAAAKLHDLSVSGDGEVTAESFDTTGPDASNLSGVEVPLTVDTTGGNVKFVGQIGAVELTVVGGGEFDITGATVDATSIVVTVGTLILTGAQADGLVIEGDGDVTLVDVASGQDFSGIAIGGTLEIEAADDATTISLTAAQLDGQTVGVTGTALTKVIVTEFEATPGADLGAVTAVFPVEIQLDSSGDVEIGAGADLGVQGATSIDLVISGNGEVTVADGADLSAVGDFVVNTGARLVADQNLTAPSLIDPADVEGAGALEVVMADTGSVTATEDVRQTIFTFEEGVEDTTIVGFTAGTFEWDAVTLEVGAHRLDFTDLFSTGPANFDDIDIAFADADQSGAADILSFSVADLATFTAAGLATALATAGDFNNAGANINFGANAEKIFLVSDGTDAQAFFWQDGRNAANDGVVQAAELTEIVELTGVKTVDLGDLVNANFVFAA